MVQQFDATNGLPSIKGSKRKTTTTIFSFLQLQLFTSVV